MTLLKFVLSAISAVTLGSCTASPLYTGEYHSVKPDLTKSVPRDSNGEPVLDAPANRPN